MSKALWFVPACAMPMLLWVASAPALDFAVGISNDLYFHDQWSNTAGSYVPRLSHTDTIWVLQPAAVYVFFTDYDTGADGAAALTYDYEVRNSRGRVTKSDKGLDAVHERPPFPHACLLSTTAVRMMCGTDQPPGWYTVTVKVTDHVSRKRQTKRERFYLAQWHGTPTRSFTSDSALLAWMRRYYVEPKPEGLLGAFRYYANSNLINDDSLFNGLFYFFCLGFQANPFLAPVLLQGYSQYSEPLQEYTPFLLCAIGYDVAAMAKAIPPKTLDKFAGRARAGLPDPVDRWSFHLDPSLAVHDFYYSGRIAAVNLLVRTMWSRDTRTLPDSMMCDTCMTPLMKEAYRTGAYYHRAKTTLTQLYRDHLLVQGYCDYMYRHADLKPIVREELGKIIMETPELDGHGSE